MDTKVFFTESPEETAALAARLAARVRKDGFIALYGEMGVGKTAFVRGLVHAAAPNDPVCSPTYSLVNEYRSGAYPIFHFDVYRIDDEEALYSAGFYDYIGEGLIVCEWSEKIPYAIPKDAIRVRIEKLSYEEAAERSRRKITVTGEDLGDLYKIKKR